MLTENEFTRGLVSIEPTPEDIGDIQEELGGTPPPDEEVLQYYVPRDKELIRQLGRREKGIQLKEVRRKITNETWRIAAFSRRRIREVLSQGDNPLQDGFTEDISFRLGGEGQPLDQLGRAQTAQPTNGELGRMVLFEGKGGQRLRPIFQAARQRTN